MKIQLYNNSTVSGIYLLFIFMLVGCKNLIEVDSPVDKITPNNVYNSDAGAASVLNGIYSDLTFSNQIAIGANSIGFLCGLSADEISLKLTNNVIRYIELYQNNIQSVSDGPAAIWNNLYGLIFRANSAIDGINGSMGMTPAGRKELLAESRFIRAFAYFYLVSLYGDVPLVINSNVIQNSKAPKLPTSQIYNQIILDLKYAQENLSKDYLNGDLRTISPERVRPNLATATALLARVYLYTSQWADAERETTSIIENPNYQLVPLNEVFKKTSKESIWQLQMTSLLQASDGGFYIPVVGGIEKTYYLSNQIYNSFESGDQRKEKWVHTYNDGTGTANYPYKYQDRALSNNQQISEYAVVFRLAEQYLIRAEARARLNKIIGPNSAKSDVDVIRSRANLLGTLATTQSGMLNAIWQERRVEFFTEWGHRWVDLKRTGTIDNVMEVVAPEKGGVWKSYKALYPIPMSEIQKNPSLSGHQNTGY